MIEELLPRRVAAAETFGDSPDATLFPQEEVALVRAVDKRRREFATARFCARRALAELGVAPVPVLPGPAREPLWPTGVVGSITHCAGYRAAAVAQAVDLLAIGIDAEPDSALPNSVLAHIATPGERLWVDRITRTDPDVSWDKLLFCAKESAYKTWFPLARRWLDFQDAEVEFDTMRRTFSVRLLVAGISVAGRRLTDLSGRWLVGHGLLLTAITIPAD